MDYVERLPRKGISRSDMLKRVARFSELKGFDGGHPDSLMPGCHRVLYNVLGFQRPHDQTAGQTSPVGDDASAGAAIKVSEGFNLGFVKVKPGNGPMFHNHDTNETFVPLTGRWRAHWLNETNESESVDLGPNDVISFPPGVIRRFENVTEGDPEAFQTMLFVVGGDAPRGEFPVESVRELAAAGLWRG